ncbi:MAG TPA: hypothetical protein VFV78_10955, partial [Vicinamibacterales bacterium]|nr:hypothetical protein [Vicinamibacterales bacterium]
IGASDSWHWEPYDNAYVTIAGERPSTSSGRSEPVEERMPSVPGGGHHFSPPIIRRPEGRRLLRMRVMRLVRQEDRKQPDDR